MYCMMYCYSLSDLLLFILILILSPMGNPRPGRGSRISGAAGRPCGGTRPAPASSGLLIIITTNISVTISSLTITIAIMSIITISVKVVGLVCEEPNGGGINGGGRIRRNNVLVHR